MTLVSARVGTKPGLQADWKISVLLLIQADHVVVCGQVKFLKINRHNIVHLNKGINEALTFSIHVRLTDGMRFITPLASLLNEI